MRCPIQKEIKRITTSHPSDTQGNKVEISLLTTYDYSMARIVDAAGIDIILVGDSASNVMVWSPTDNLDQMIIYAQSVIRATERAFCRRGFAFRIVSGQQYKSAQFCHIHHENQVLMRLRWKVDLKLKILIRILSAGIPVMGHLGIDATKHLQIWDAYGVRAKEEAEAEKLISDAKLLEKFSCFALVLENTRTRIKVAQALHIPVMESVPETAWTVKF